ncbi:translation initiation factor IF-2 subunit beta [Candidatus Pacearchaeota archaeon]|nr:MAG: translation initiation factor IF-2 subunit beta [Candidatus Pacearchaeota archaeon]
MEYEALLENAYRKIKPIEKCKRFEIIKVQGHYEGSKTIVKNFLRISSCIRRPYAHLMKFLSKELASPAEISGERLIFQRKISPGDINLKIKKYVKEFVLCPKCKKPDTELITRKSEAILHCLACGAKYSVHEI